MKNPKNTAVGNHRLVQQSLSYLALASMLFTTMSAEAIEWTDPSLPGTAIKAVHLQELRDAIDNSIGGHWTGVTGGIKYTGGKVGIGTAAPVDLLDVRGIFRLSDGGAGEAANMRLIDTNNDNFLIHLNSDRLYFMRDDNNNISWDDGEEDRITMYGVTDGLRLGVGTSSPTHKLDVRGNGIFSGNLSVPTPINNEHATTKGYVDTAIASGDSNKIDGLDSTQFLRSDANDTATGWITFTNPIKVNNTFNVDGSGPSAQKDGLYTVDLGGTQGTTLNPTYTAAIVGQVAAHRSVALTVDTSGYLYGYRTHSNPGTYTFQSKTRYADNANTLDNIDSASFARKDAVNSFSSSYVTTFNNVAGRKYDTSAGGQTPLQIYQGTANADAAMTFHVAGDHAAYFGLDGTTNDLFVGGWSKGANKYKIWHAGNDGAGSLLVADKLDDIDSSQFVRSDADDTISGQMKFTNINGIQWENGVNRITHNDGGGNVQLRFGHDFSDSAERFTHGQTAFYVGGSLDSANGSLQMKVATNGGAGNDQPVTWGPTFFITETGATLNGNVGIGTMSPSAITHLYKGGLGVGRTDLLKIEGNRGDFGPDPSGIAILFKDQDTNNAANEARIKMMTVNDVDYGDNDEAASNLVFETTNGGVAADKMIITGRGDIGIGTMNPTAKLHVQGNGMFSGNVGIGAAATVPLMVHRDGVESQIAISNTGSGNASLALYDGGAPKGILWIDGNDQNKLKINSASGTAMAISDTDIDVQNNIVKNLGTPIAGTDAANKDYVDAAAGGMAANCQVICNGTCPSAPTGWVLRSATGRSGASGGNNTYGYAAGRCYYQDANGYQHPGIEKMCCYFTADDSAGTCTDVDGDRVCAENDCDDNNTFAWDDVTGVNCMDCPNGYVRSSDRLYCQSRNGMMHTACGPNDQYNNPSALYRWNMCY